MRRSYPSYVTAAAVTVLVCSAQGARAQIAPVGNEFQVNTYTTGPQAQGIEGYFSRQLVSRAANGDFVVVWASSFDQDGYGDGIFGQRFDASGGAVGTEFQVNSYTTDYQAHPAVGQLAGGGFVVVWESDYQDGDTRGVFGQRFQANGSRAGGEFQANTYTTSYQRQPSVAATADGGFVVVWTSSYQDGSDYGVFGARFASSGAPVGTEFQVNSYTTANQGYQVVAASASGGFVVVWESFGQDGNGNGVFGQRFSATGARSGTEFQVNTYTTGHQDSAHVDMDASGGFVIVWRDFGQTLDVFARRYASNGTPLGAPFPVTSSTVADLAAVAVNDDGSFVVVFMDYGVAGSDPPDVIARHFDTAGVPSDGGLVVNTYTNGFQGYPSVATDGEDGFVVVWIDYNDHDGDARGVFARQLGRESDGDGTADAVDNCPLIANPDQLDSDCPDPTFFPSGGCKGSIPSANTGCCDGGDVCDACPAQKDNSNCDPALSAAATIGTAGGVVQTSEVNGTISATVVIPPNALTTDTSISVTENGPATTFGLRREGGTADVLSTSMRPEGFAFLLPVTITLRWDDRDRDGIVDRGVCESGSDLNLPCDADADCAGSTTCSIRSSIPEHQLIARHNSRKFGRNGIGMSPYRCDQHLRFTCSLDGTVSCDTDADCASASAGSCTSTLAPCSSSHADCGSDAGSPDRTVARCCDPTAGATGTRTFGEWEFETCDFSEFLVGLDASALVAGKGSPKTDCIFEWAPNNPLNERYLDGKGLPNFKQECRDGDPVCDRDDTMNGVCALDVALCMNVADPRLVKDSQVECEPSDVARWRVIRPRPDSGDAAEQSNAIALIGGAVAFGGEADGTEVAFATPVTETAACGRPIRLLVPLRGDGTKKGKATIKVITETSPAPGKNTGTKDTDTLKITCQP